MSRLALAQVAYFGALALVIEAKVFDLRWLEYLAKPLLMPLLCLVLFLVHRAMGAEVAVLSLTPIVAALVFATLGDTFLMFDGGFKAGLASFFVMQCFYAYLLWPREAGAGDAWSVVIAVGLVALSFFVQYSLVEDRLGAIRIPAVIYFFSFSIVLVLAVLRYVASPSEVNAVLLLGVVLFYVSDTLIALSLFRSDFPLSGASIMLTYGIGQYLFLTSLLRSAS